jgi:hypothetical protein
VWTDLVDQPGRQVLLQQLHHRRRPHPLAQQGTDCLHGLLTGKGAHRGSRHARDQWLIDCLVDGDVTASAKLSRLENNIVRGSVKADKVDSSYIPRIKTIYDTAPPTDGHWDVGDKVWHSAPEPDGHIGWVCVRGGSPGTWKEFGRISG